MSECVCYIAMLLTTTSPDQSLSHLLEPRVGNVYTVCVWGERFFPFFMFRSCRSVSIST